jgi:putative membrane protein
MSERSFYEEQAKGAAKAAVASIEAQTSAEIVVCLRGASWAYREADYLCGFIVSVGALVTMLYVERTFQLASFPLGVVAAFLLGAVVSANLPAVRRIFTMPGRKRDAVRAAARAAFVDLGVSRTHGRTGVLVYISMFERRVEVVPDVGIDAAPLGPEWKAAVAALERSLTPSPSVDRFLTAMRALGPILGKALPHAEDDVNELPDEVQSG